MDQSIPSPIGEEAWESLHADQKATILKPYFDAEAALKPGEKLKRNRAIAAALKISIFSVALQRAEYEKKLLVIAERMSPIPLEEPLWNVRLKKASLPMDGKYPNPPPPAHSGTEWWRSLTPSEKRQVVRVLVRTYGMSSRTMATYLSLTLGRIASVRKQLHRR